MEKAYLVLSDGRTFEGIRIGAKKDSTGELVFTTGMVGYLETLSDPSYAGQIVMQTFPLIGNYGVIKSDFEGDCAARGYVVRELCDVPSNFRCEQDLDSWLKEQDVPGIMGVDTREITRILREEGVMNACICSQPPSDLTPVQAYRVGNAVQEISCREKMLFPAKGEKRFDVTLIDYGKKKSIVECLQKYGCDVLVVPQNTTAEEIMALNPDGIMLSNGPGDPQENTGCIREIAKLIGKKPVFGICLGHQMTALAMGGRTYKLKYGHRGANQPVREIGTVNTYITCQNHGYAVDADSLAGIGRATFVNANDLSCEGMEYPGKKCFTVQFHPEACSGPKDAEFLFRRFIKMMEGGRVNAKG